MSDESATHALTPATCSARRSHLAEVAESLGWMRCERLGIDVWYDPTGGHVTWEGLPAALDDDIDKLIAECKDKSPRDDDARRSRNAAIPFFRRTPAVSHTRPKTANPVSTQTDSTPKASAELSNKGVGCDALLAVCKNCRHWSKALDWFDPRDGVEVRFCQHAMVCQPSHGKRDNRRMTASGVLTMDEGGCTGELCTGPDFGCRHFSANVKDEPRRPTLPHSR